jgi:hypothetical protein
VIKSKIIKWARHVARIGDGRGLYRVLVEKPERKRTLGKLRRRWDDNIKMDLQEVRYGDVECIDMAQDWDRWRALVTVATNLRVS